MTTGFNHVTNGHPFFVAVFIPHTHARANTKFNTFTGENVKTYHEATGNTIAYYCSTAVMRHLHFSFYQKYATRIFVCVIAVSKSQEFLLKVRRLSVFFSTTTPTPSRRRVVIFSTTTQGIRLRRRVDVFSTTSDTKL